MKKMFKKWDGGAKKHGGLGNAMGAQAQAWAAPVIEQAQKIDGGAEKHGGLGQAALVYIGVSSSSEEAARLEAVRCQAEEAEARRALEAVAKREAEEAEARRVIEAVQRREAEELEARRALESVAKREAEEVVAKAELAQEVAKSLKKGLSMKECMFEFAERFPGEALDDIKAIELMSWLTKSVAPTIGAIIDEVRSLHDPVLNEAANQWIMHHQPEGVELIGGDILVL